MMSCTKLYVEPTEELMNQARKERLLSLTNIFSYLLKNKSNFHYDISFAFFLSQP